MPQPTDRAEHLELEVDKAEHLVVVEVDRVRHVVEELNRDVARRPTEEDVVVSSVVLTIFHTFQDHRLQLHHSLLDHRFLLHHSLQDLRLLLHHSLQGH